jgi:hypothetical protein
VGKDAHPGLGRDALVEGVAADDVQVVLALGAVTPQRAADQGIDAVGADHDVRLVDPSVREVQPNTALVLLDAFHRVVDLQDSPGQRVEQPLVQFGAQQTDEAAAVVADDLLRNSRADPAAAAGVAELGYAGCPQVLDVHPEQSECLDGRGPQVEDGARRPGLRVALEQHDVVAGLVDGECGGQATRAGADDGDAAALGGGLLHGAFLSPGRRGPGRR